MELLFKVTTQKMNRIFGGLCRVGLRTAPFHEQPTKRTPEKNEAPNLGRTRERADK